MKLYDFDYHLENLKALDPDQLVSELGVSTEDIIDAFPAEVDRFIEREYG
jgi:hypothetical protein